MARKHVRVVTAEHPEFSHSSSVLQWGSSASCYEHEYYCWQPRSPHENKPKKYVSKHDMLYLCSAQVLMVSCADIGSRRLSVLQQARSEGASRTGPPQDPPSPRRGHQGCQCRLGRPTGKLHILYYMSPSPKGIIRLFLYCYTCVWQMMLLLTQDFFCNRHVYSDIARVVLDVGQFANGITAMLDASSSGVKWCGRQGKGSSGYPTSSTPTWTPTSLRRVTMKKCATQPLASPRLLLRR